MRIFFSNSSKNRTFFFVLNHIRTSLIFFWFEQEKLIVKEFHIFISIQPSRTKYLSYKI